MLKTAQVVEGYRLSPQQKRVWLLQQDSQAYNAQCAILIEGDLESKALESALKNLMRKHEILRTTLGQATDFETPVQIILEDISLPYRIVDLSDKRFEDLDIVLNQLFDEESRHFDYKRGLLARFCLGQLSAMRSILLLSLSSLCADSRTLRNLFKEVCRFYAAELQGKELSEDTLPYLQFSEWQNELLEELENEKAESRVRRPAPELKLPLEFNSARVAGSEPRRFSPEFHALTLDLQLAERIEAISNLSNHSASVFLLACWQILLWRHTGEQEIGAEFLFDGRQFDELQDALGLFAGYAPAPATLGRGLRFNEVVERTRKALQQLSVSQELFLTELADGKEIDRTNRIGFEYEEWPKAEHVGTARFSYWKHRCCIDRFKLKLGGCRKADGLTIEIQYDPAIFSWESVELIAGRYLRLIEDAVERQDAPIGDLEMLGRSELDRLLIEWNQTEEDIPWSECLHKMVARQAERTPDQLALIDHRQRLSYRDLNRRVNRIGHYLQGVGVGPEVVVGVFLGRSVEMIVAALGTLKAGGAYLPLDPESPLERLAFMLEDAGVGVVLTERELEGRLPSFWGQSICLDEEWERIDEESESEPESGVEPENTAYLIYTSGSTGRPKGVMVRHRSLVNYTFDICRRLRLAEVDGGRLQFATVSTITADLGNTCIFPSLVSGGCLHILSYETATDGEQYEEYLRREPIDVLKITPSHLGALIRSQPMNAKMLPSRYLILGGEALSFELADQIKTRDEECEVINHYGPTETTIGSLTAKVKEEERRSDGSAPIGQPISNTESYVTDQELRLVPVGVKGELYLGGEGLARGYRSRPDLTAERFIPNLFGRKAGARLYQTGDVVRRLSDGKIEFVGRADNQVKVRGYRVELGEIETTLRANPGVMDAAVVLREDEFGEKRLVAYVVGRHERVMNGKPRLRLPNGMAIVGQNRNETEYLYEEIFKRKRYFKYGISLSDGGCVFDVGANIGLFTLFVDLNRKGLRVYSFEPIKPIYETLKTNVQLYGGSGVKLYHMGIGDKERTEWFTYYRGYSMMSGQSRYARVSEDIETVKRCMLNGQMPEELLRESNELLSRKFEEEKYWCEVRRLTDVIREEKIERIDLLKVDVQRAEMDVLRGLKEADWKKIDQIVMEVHDQTGSETEGRLAQIRELLMLKGYKVTVEQDEVLRGTDRHNLYARRNGGFQLRGETEWREAPINEPLEVTPEDLGRFVREKLPDYMAPAAIVILEKLPLTRNGKLDRAALPAPEEIEKHEEGGQREEWGAYEELVGGIWKEVLKVERVRPGDNFFELGGHSLLATQMVSRVRATFGIEIGVMSVFEEQTVRGFAAKVEDAMNRGVKDQAPPLIRVERGEKTPLSFAQERLWFLDQLMPNNPLYNISRVVRLGGRLDVPALERVINEVIRRHEALRTRIEAREGEPMQVIDAWKPRRLEVEDLTGLPQKEKEEEIRRVADEEATAGFDLSRGPLLRVKILKLEENEHVLLCAMHHIVSDGWSTGILIREVRALYQAFIDGEPSPLDDLPIQYADFAIWQREYLQGATLLRELQYWREQLAGVKDLQLPADHSRPAIPTYRGANRYFALEQELVENLRAFSRRVGVTLFMTLMAAFKAVLMKYCGVDDVSVGTVIANRTRKEIEGLIGFFINTLVLRTDLSGNPNFRELVERERVVALGAYARQELPFEKLVEELNPQRDLSRSPLFQVMMILQNTEREVLKLQDVNLSGVPSGPETDDDVLQTAKFDLTLTITDMGQRLEGIANYSLDLFEGVTIERMMNHYANVLMAIEEESERPLSELSLLSAGERAQIVVEWNETGRPYPQARLIHDLFELQVEIAPEAVALTDGDRRLSYAELNARANQLARHLRKLGIGPESLVGVCMGRSLEMVIGLVSILKAGGAYLPLDLTYPEERIAFMLEDAQVKTLLTERRLSGMLRASDVQIVALDAEWPLITTESAENLPDRTTAENLAYAIYTSGSTGRPKGVMAPHRQVVNFFTAMDAEIEPDPSGVWMAVTSVSFDISALELLWTLTRGFQVVVYREERITRPGVDLEGSIDGKSGETSHAWSAGKSENASLAGQMIRHQVTHLQCTPSMAMMLSMEAEWIEAAASLRKLVVGGEAFPRDLAEKLREVLKAEIRNMYGPTETTVWSATYALRGEEMSVPIGRPVANTQIYIMDRALGVTPAGVAGELYIGGEGVVRGYLKRAELTGDRFMPDEFSLKGGGRVYRTGDLARYRNDGLIEFLGRVDYQVKIRGYRIELGEIENELRAHPAVRQCVVTAHEDEAGERRLVAYVVFEKESESKTGELRRYLKEKLPEYMTPWWIVRLDDLPILPNGKVDRRSLPSPNVKGAGEGEGYMAPRTPVEEITAGIFEELLKQDRVGIHDNFFELGGHSLLAMKVISRVRAALGVDVGLRIIFEEPTVEGLAGKAEELLKAGERDKTLALVRIEREGQGDVRLPLSFAQQRLWFIDQLEPGNTAYIIPGAVRLEGKIDLAVLERVINEVVRRHETLRTRFEAEAGAPIQVIDEWRPRKLEVLDLRSMPQAEREAEVERRKREEARTGFDLSKGPLLRVTAFILEEEQFLVIFSMHHIIGDRWSMGILFKEVGALYQAYIAGESSPLPELEIQYADFTLWQRQWLQGEILEKQSAYWKQRFAGAPSFLQLPTDRPRPAIPTYDVAYEGFVLTPDLIERLKRLSRDEDLTLFMIFLAAYQLLLARYSGQDRIVVGTPIAGRNRKETEGLIGLFVNILVIVTDLSGNPTAGELLKRVRETAIGAFTHQDLPFEKLVEVLQPERDLSRQPLFQVVFAFQNQMEELSTISNLGGRSEGIEVENANFEISLTVVENSGRMAGYTEYAADIYERESMAQLLEHLRRLLEGMTANQGCPVMDIPLLSKAEREQVLTWNRTAVEYPAEKRVHQLFEQQVDRAPERIAVISEGAEISYGDLNRRANQLGNYLRKRGVGPEVRVGICLERGVEMLVGLLAILKAGGAYVPLDPEYPAERLSLMLKDAAALLIVTREKLRDALEARQADLICIDSDHGAIVLESEENIESGVGGENLTYVIYTSGSTGRPKGAMITHQSAVNLVTDAVKKLRLGQDSRFLQFASLSFDVAVEEIHPVWSVGGAVVLLPDKLSYSYSGLTKTMERHEVTTVELPTAYWREWMRELLRAGRRAPRCLELVITGDERIPAEVFKEWKKHEVSLLHVYGVTEATVNSLVYLAPVDLTDAELSAAIPIGKPTANTEVYLLDENLQPAPLRIPSEMYLGGVGLARGYLDRPELTAEKFAPSPFGKRAGSRLYKTGDLAKRSPAPLFDGCLEFVSRIDHQIKIRGYRVEPGEIEAALKSHPMVEEVVVAAPHDGSGSNKLIAYVTPKYEYKHTIDRQDLRVHIKGILPAYMTPSSFVFLDSFPLAPNGKVDRQALPAPAADDVERNTTHASPGTPLEEDVARIFREALGIKDVGIYDDFFALGGHSLLVIQVISRVNEAFEIELPIRALFDSPTVNDLVAAIVESQAGQLEDEVLSQLLAEIE